MDTIDEAALRIEECGGVDRHDEAVRFVLPFARGEWPKERGVDLVSRADRGAGSVRLISWRTVDRWPDESVRLATCIAAITLKRQSVLSIGLRGIGSGAAAIPPAPSVFSTAAPDIASTSETAGRGEGPSNDAAKVVSAFFIELGRAGMSYVLCFRADGDAATEGYTRLSVVGERPISISFDAEVKTFGREGALVTFTMLNKSLEEVRLDFSRLRVRLKEALGEAFIYELGNRAKRIPGELEPRYVQLSRIGELYLEDASPEPVQYPIGGECRQNPLWLRGFTDTCGCTIAVRNFGENFPCGCGTDCRSMYFDLWPAEAGPLVLPAGLAKTHSFGFVFDEGGRGSGGEKATPHIHLPLVPSISAKRLELLECFPPIAPYCPKRYPKLETWSKWIFANRPRSYGFFDFGDEPNFSYLARAIDQEGIFSLNNEYDIPLVILTEFCRTGERLWYEDGRAAALHMMDIDTAITAEDSSIVGGQYPHSQGHRANPPAPDHEWLEGLLLYYLLTGNERPLNAAKALADRLARLAEEGTFDSVGMTSRRYGWPLIALCSFYGFNREKRYLDAAERIVEGMRRVEEEADGLRSPYWGTPYWSLDTFMLGIAAAGLCRYHKLTEDARCAEMIVRTCKSMLEVVSAEGIFHYKEYPLVRIPEPLAGAICCEALSYCFELTGDEECLLVCARNVELLVEISRMGAMIHWNAEDRVDVPPAAYMRARIEELTGQYAGITHRGIWPFITTAEKTDFFAVHTNPFSFIVDGDVRKDSTR